MIGVTASPAIDVETALP